MKTIFIALLVLIQSLSLYSQQITTESVPYNEICQDISFKVSFKAVGNFAVSNVFFAQISNNGFSAFQNIGSINAKESGEIDVMIPANIEPAQNYRIRVCSSEPYIVGTDNGQDIKIYKKPAINFNTEDNKIIFRKNEPINLICSASEKLFSPVYWDFGLDANIESFEGLNPPQITYSTTGIKKIKMQTSSLTQCEYEYLSIKNVLIYDCLSKIGSNAVIDSTRDLQPVYEQDSLHVVWMMPNSSRIARSMFRTIYFLETGSDLEISSSNYLVFYVKKGASLRILNTNNEQIVILKAPGSSVTIENQENSCQVIDCPELKFDYSEAPKQGVVILAKMGYLDIINPDRLKDNFSISPNPPREYIEITGLKKGLQPLVSEHEFKIYNLLGECVLSVAQTFPSVDSGQTGMSDLLRIDVSGLPAGVYFVRVGEWVGRFVKI